MSKSTRRALRVTLAVAGTAVLCAAFVGTAAAAPSTDGATDGATDAPNSVESKTSEAETGLPSSGLLKNDVITAEMPNIKGASWNPTGFTAVPASDDPGDNEDRDEVCHGLNGEHEYDHDTNIQVPCQSDGNNIHEGELEIAGHAVAYLMDVPGVESDQDSVSQNGNDVNKLSDGPSALTNGLHAPEDLNHVNGQKVAVTPV